MKNLSALLLTVPFLLFSCSKDNLESNDPSITENPEGIYQQDGILHFSSAEECMETIHMLTADNADLRSFENEYNFTSLTSVVDEALDVLSEIEDPDAYAAALDAYDDLLTVTEGGLVVPRVIARGYSHIANPEGIFYVGDMKYTVTPEKVMYESTSSDTRSPIQGEYDYVSELSLVDDTFLETRAETNTKYYDERYETSDRKVFFRAHVITYSLSNASGIHHYDVQFHMSGQKKSLFGWNSYNTTFRINLLMCSIVSGNTNTIHVPGRGEYRVLSSSPIPAQLITSTELKNFYWTYPDACIIMGGATPLLYGFNTLKLRATSRGTGGCGIAINNYPFSMTAVPITPCE